MREPGATQLEEKLQTDCYQKDRFPAVRRIVRDARLESWKSRELLSKLCRIAACKWCRSHYNNPRLNLSGVQFRHERRIIGKVVPTVTYEIGTSNAEMRDVPGRARKT